MKAPGYHCERIGTCDGISASYVMNFGESETMLLRVLTFHLNNYQL